MPLFWRVYDATRIQAYNDGSDLKKQHYDNGSVCGGGSGGSGGDVFFPAHLSFSFTTWGNEKNQKKNHTRLHSLSSILVNRKVPK